MIINLATINFDENSGGGGTPARLQAKTFGISRNGTTEVLPDEGFDGMTEVTLYSYFYGNTSGLDFASIGYDAILSNEANSFYNNDVAYSKTLYDAWDENNTSAANLYYNKKIVFAPAINTSNVTNMSYMFHSCTLLTTIPQLDTSNVTNMSNMFYNCTSLTTIPKLDTSKVTIMKDMFNGCTALTTIPQLDTSNVTNMSYMFQDCKALTSIPLLDCGNVTNIGTFFGYNNITTLTELGGFKNLKINWSEGMGLYKLPNLTYQSVMNVINNLYDFRANGDNSTTRTLKLNANSLALLTDDDKAIATSKGWVLS